MNRILSCFLALILVFNLTVSPVSAADVSDIDAISTLESAGYTVKSLAAGSVLIGGAGGVASIATVALPCLAFIVAMGVTGTTPYQLVEWAMQMYNNLATETLAALQKWLDSGDDTFELSSDVAADFEQAFKAIFFTDDGSFAAFTGLAFDSSLLLSYSNDYFISGSTYPVDLFTYDLSFSAPTVLGDTGLIVQLVSNTFDATSDYALKVTNTVTDVVGLFTISSFSCDNIDDSVSLKISMPTVETYTTSTGVVFYRIVWFVLSEFADDAIYKYMSFSVGDNGNSFVLDGLANYDYNGVVGSVTITGDHVTWSVLDDVYQDYVTPAVYVVGTARPVTQDGEYAAPLVGGDVLTMPTELERENITDYTAEDARGLTDVETDKSWLQSLLDGLTGILEAIFVPDLSGFQELVDVYTSKFNWVGDIYHFMDDFIRALQCDVPPKVSIDLSMAESPGGYNWGGKTYALDMTWYSRYKESVDTILSGILWVFFLWRLFKRIPDILSGIGIAEEYSGLDRGWIKTEQAERKERKERRSH